jgi:hypothetical protein
MLRLPGWSLSPRELVAPPPPVQMFPLEEVLVVILHRALCPPPARMCQWWWLQNPCHDVFVRQVMPGYPGIWNLALYDIMYDIISS